MSSILALIYVLFFVGMLYAMIIIIKTLFPMLLAIIIVLILAIGGAFVIAAIKNKLKP